MLGARVEFHNAATGSPVTVDVGHVFAHLPHPEQEGTFIVAAGGFGYHVSESYAEVTAAIKKATERH
jgi:hypothetical protein